MRTKASAPKARVDTLWSVVRSGPVAVVVLAIALIETVAFIAPNESTAVDLGAVLLAVAGAAAALSLVRSRGVLVDGRLTWAWGAFLGWALVCVAFSGRLWAALAGESSSMLGWFALIAFSAIVALGVREKDALQRLLVAASPWVVLLQCVVIAGQLASHRSPNGTMPNSSYTGELILLLLPWVSSGLGRGPASWRRLWRPAVAGVAVVTLVASGSRVAAVLALVWFVWQLYSDKHLSARIRFGAIGVVAALGALAGVLFARGEFGSTLTAAALGDRPAMARGALAAVQASPIVGYGPDGFQWGAAAQGHLTFGPDPHNVLLWVVTSVGIVGLLVFLWALAEVVMRWVRTQAEGNDRRALWAVSLVFVMMLTTPLPVELLPLFALVVGMSLTGVSASAKHDENRTARMVAWAVVALICVISGANSATRWTLDAPSAQASPSKAGWATTASSIWPLDSYLAYLGSQHVGYAVAADPGLAAGQPDLVDIKRAVATDSRNAVFALELARTLNAYAAPPAETDAAFRETLRRSPSFPLAQAEYALWLALQGRAADARQHLALAEPYAVGDPTVAGILDRARQALGPK